MFRISTHGRYALRMMADIAEQTSNNSHAAGQTNNSEEQVKMPPLPGISKQQEIPKKYLEQLAIQLIKADLLKGTRGHNGGYRLTKPAEEIRVIDVLNAVETSMTVVGCLKETPVDCPQSGECKTLPLWTGLQKEITDTNPILKTHQRSTIRQ
jgi:Rrf2 family protein